MSLLFAIVSAVVVLITVEAGYVTPCGAGDQACVDSMGNDVYQQLMKGVPKMGIEPCEPINHPLIVGDLAGLKYTFYNATISGMDKCTVSKVNFNQETLKVGLHLSCPKIVIKSDYETNGALLMVPVHGKGDCSIVTGLYNFDFNCDVKVSDGSDNKPHLSIKSCRMVIDAVGPLEFDVNNLFDGNKEMSDAFHDFIHANWKEVHDFVKDPLWKVHVKKMIGIVNTWLKNVPLDDMKSSK